MTEQRSASIDNPKIKFPWSRGRSQVATSEAKASPSSPEEPKAATTQDTAKSLNIFQRFDRRAKPKIDAFEATATAHILGYIGAILSAAALVGTFFQLVAYVEDREREWISFAEEREARARDREIQEEERYERAWDRLLRRDVGDIRKGAALNVLLNAGVPLQSLDLSCRAIGIWNTSEETCDQEVTFSGLEMAGEATSLEQIRTFIATRNADELAVANEFRFKSIAIDRFQEATIVNGNFSGNLIEWSEAAPGPDIMESNLSAVYMINLSSKSPSISGSDLSFSIWDLSDAGPEPFHRLDGNNMTGTILLIPSSATIIDTSAEQPEIYRYGFIGPVLPPMNIGWAWADMPPMIWDSNLQDLIPARPDHLHGINFLNPECREGWRRDPAPDLASLVDETLTGLAPKLESRTEGADIEGANAWVDGTIEDYCIIGDWMAAARQFPKRYPSVPQGYSRFDPSSLVPETP